MITLRKSADRGHADHGWLKSMHSFSFADYHDPAHMGVGNLRVINEDRIAPGTGFGTHGHRDMEIVSYVLDGALAHQDSMGNGSGHRPGVIRPGDVQRMSAGTGVRTASSTTPADRHALPADLDPAARGGIAPGYEQKHFDAASKRGRLRLVASPDGREGSVTIHADASAVRAACSTATKHIEQPLDPAAHDLRAPGARRCSVNGQACRPATPLTLDQEAHAVSKAAMTPKCWSSTSPYPLIPSTAPPPQTGRTP
jgi:redox-sensitive bicupin YhaK (pirin superfamily)